MADITECPVCFEEYMEPKLLPCTHTLCLNCLESLQKSDKKGRHIRCPLCNTKHKVPDRGVKAFIENQHVIQLILYKEKMKDMEKRLKTGQQTKARKKEADNLNAEAEQLAAISLQETNNNKNAEKAENTIDSCSSEDIPDSNGFKNEAETSTQQPATADVRPKVKIHPGVDANLVTFSRQKLALLQCEYDPKRCSCCVKHVEELKQCMKCKTAKYCSRECQAKDWKGKHKKHCKELERLRETVTSEQGSIQMKGEQAKGMSVCDSPSQKAAWKERHRVIKKEGGGWSLNVATRTEHDRHCCSHCGKPSLVVQLRTCSNCKSSQYCSRECQAEDWRAKHKKECQKRKKLQGMTFEAGERANTRLDSQECGKSWSFDSDVLVHRIHTHDDKIIMIGSTRANREHILAVYDVSTGSKKQEVRRQKREFFSFSVCTVRTDKSCYIAVSSGTREGKSRIDLWPLSLTPPEPISTYTGGTKHFGALHFFEGKLYVFEDGTGSCVEELDVSTIPIQPTGFTVSFDVAKTEHITDICVIRENGKKCFILNSCEKGLVDVFLVRCMDSRGQQLWRINQQHLDGALFEPWNICTDHEGHIFAFDMGKNRVVIINRDLSLQTFIGTQGVVRCISWCEYRHRLYVVHESSNRTKTVTACYDVHKVDMEAMVKILKEI